MDIRERLRLIQEGQIDTPPAESPGQLIHEAYYGKNEKLLECERLMEKALRSKDGRKEVKQVQAILQEMFNFKKLVISTLPASLAMTIPVTTFKFKYVVKKLELQRTETGVAFKTEDQVEAVIFIDLTLMALGKFTGAECVGIILHEIGHSMKMVLPSAQIQNALTALAFGVTVVPLIMYMLLNKFITPTFEKVDNFIARMIDNFSKVPRRDAVAAKETQLVISGLFGTFTTIRNTIAILTHNQPTKIFLDAWKRIFLATIGVGKKLNVVGAVIAFSNIFTLKSRYRQELLSDYISTVYGYGGDIISSLGKFNTRANTLMIRNPLTRLLSLPFSIVRLAFDPHPLNITRFQAIVDNLEKELKKEINEDAYDEIKKDLDEAKKKLEEFKKVAEKSKFKDKDIVIYRKAMNKIIKNNDDIRILFFGLRPKDLNYIDGLEELPKETKDPQTLQECYDILKEFHHFDTKDRESLMNLIGPE